MDTIVRDYREQECCPPPPLNLLWELTLRCNCRCTHCAAGGGTPRADELNTEEALAVCEQVAELRASSVCLMGGEALLRPDWDLVALRLRELGVTALGLATNGIALDTETWRRLEILGFCQVVISLDGIIPEVHDRRRRRPGASQAAKRGIVEMASRPLAHKTVITSVDIGNIGELSAIRNWLLENAPGVTWAINYASPTPEGRLQRSDSIGVDHFLYLTQFISANRARYREQLDIIGAHGLGYCSECYPDLGDFTWSGCQAGISTLGLRSDGNVTGCLILPDHFIEGNVRERSLSEIWRDYRSFRYNRSFSADMLTGECSGCRWGEICRGGCREIGFSWTGSPFEAPFCLYRLESCNDLSVAGNTDEARK